MMADGSRLIEELERTLPAGSKPLVMHAYQAAVDVASEFVHFATDNPKKDPSIVQLTLIAMRKYLELFAVVSGTGAPMNRLVTFSDFERAMPLLRSWGVLTSDPKIAFQRLDKLSSGILRFDDVGRWLMRTQMEMLSNPALARHQSSRSRERPSGALALTPPPNASRAGGVQALATTFSATERKAAHLVVQQRGGARGMHLSRSPFRARPGSSSSAAPARPKAISWDLAERLSEAGLSQYTRQLKAMGFVDVKQLLALQCACDPRDSTRLDVDGSSWATLLDSLNLAPGHRVRMEQFFQNEARKVAHASHEQLLSAANHSAARDVIAAERAREEEVRLLRRRVAELEQQQSHGYGGGRGGGGGGGGGARSPKPSTADVAPRMSHVARAAKSWFEAPRHVGGVMWGPWERTLRPVFEAWRGEGGAKKRQEALLRRLIHQEVGRAFNQWIAVYDGMRKLQRTLRRWAKVPLARGFSKWAERTEGLARSAEALGEARRFVLGLMNAQLKRGFEGWRQHVEALKEATSRLRRATSRIVNAAVAYAFDAWRETAASLKEQKGTMLKVVRFFAGGLTKAWTTWKAQLEPFQRLRRAASAFGMQSVHRAWAAWVEATSLGADAARQLQVARKALMRLQHQDLARGWGAWAALVEERDRRLATMRAAYARMLLQGAVRCLNSWREHAETRRHEEQLRRRFVASLLNRGVARAWNAWLERTGEAKQMRKVLVRYSNQLLVKCWLGWYRFHRLQKASRLKRLGNALWNAEDRVAKALWDIEGAIERRLRGAGKRGAEAARKGDDDDDDDDDDELDEYRYGHLADTGAAPGRRPMDASWGSPLLPAMDGPFARRGSYTSSLAAQTAVDEYRRSHSIR